MFQPWAMNFNDVSDEATANWVEIFMHESLPALSLTAFVGEAGSYCALPRGRPAPPDLSVVAEFDLYFGYQRGSYRLA